MIATQHKSDAGERVKRGSVMRRWELRWNRSHRHAGLSTTTVGGSSASAIRITRDPSTEPAAFISTRTALHFLLAPHRGDPSLFVAIFDEAGRCAFSKGTGTDDFGNGETEVAFDPSGNLLVLGITQEGLLDLGGGAFTAHGGSGFLVKLGP